MDIGQRRLQPYFPALTPLTNSLSGYAYPLIRVIAGAFLMPHGAQKLFEMFGGKTDFYVQFFSKLGLEPALPLVYAAGSVEFFGGLLVALGLFTRFAAAACFVMLTVAWYTVHLTNGFFWTKAGIEYPLLWSLVMLAFVFGGGGKLSLDHKLGKEI
jgi:putative oxidoreductase